ncbi:MAG TPA: hypothetical protein VGW37_13930 [Terriglobia bacterium]|nr:hypothetical protein [Terriglobia bacterium]HEV2247746.1 hypothetical protein [Terriglobia bacterium]
MLWREREAMDVLKRAITLDPYRARIYRNLMLLCVKTHHYAEALSVVKRSGRFCPKTSR